ncbi:BON domain-containing protein [Cupriavidus sp. 30B13]|uniref:BON domain-containing protein n=1 Tax=Cupriavidus sp. 30B13 TaxID=3384241 RepID=UPI003B91C0CF
MDDRYDERYRRGQPRRGYEAGSQDREEWQPRPGAGAGGWDGERRRQRLAPGQLSDGGPARDDRGYERGYEREYGHDRYPDHPAERRGHQGSDLRYGLNGRYDPDDDAWRLGASYGGHDQDEPRGDARRSGQRGYFSEIGERSGYTTPYRGVYGNQRGDEYGNPYREDFRTSQRRYRDDFGEESGDNFREGPEHGPLYQLGHRLGEAVGEMFGQHDGGRDPARESRWDARGQTRRTGPKGYQRSDERIHEAICEHLAYARGVDVSEVSVEVAGGVATLSGTVRSRSEKYDIEDLVDNVFGVTEVQNNIRVARHGGAGGGGYVAAPLSASGSPAGPAAASTAAVDGTVGGAGGDAAAADATPAKMTDLKTWKPD